MRVYHFVNAQFGLEDIERRRLKLALLGDLNDPFEWFAMELGDPNLRHHFREVKHIQSESIGLLCFSKKWNNPVQWSHYADRHRGICLGFDVPCTALTAIQYVSARLPSDWVLEETDEPAREAGMLANQVSKYSHWRYEHEVRVGARLENAVNEGGCYFQQFSDELVLSEVIVGAESKIDRSTLNTALGSLVGQVKCRKARLAFKTFRVVEQKNADLWS